MRACRVLSSWAALAGIIVIATSSRSGAQSPVGTAFTYQGSLSDGAVAASGSYDFEMSLWDGPSTGTMVGSTLEVGDVAVTGGLFTVLLDFGNQFNGNARWLEIAVRPGAETGLHTTLTPRQRLTPAPVAIHAGSADVADLLDGLDSLSFADAAHAHNGADINAGLVGEVFIDAAITRDAELRGLMLERDGAGSGLDADLFDGRDSADFSSSVHDHDARYFTETELAKSGGGSEVHFDNLVGVPPMVGDFHSLDAVDGNPVDAVFVDAQGKTGMGTTAPRAGLHVAQAGPAGSSPRLLARVFDGDGTFNRLTFPTSVFVSGTRAYVTASIDNALTIIDVADPANPTLLSESFDGDGKFSRLDNPQSVFVSGGVAFVASVFDNSLTIMNVSNPQNPTLLKEVFDGDGQFNRLGGASGVFVEGTIAYVVSRFDHSLTTINVSDPSSPALLSEVFDEDGEFKRLAGARSVFVKGATAYVVSEVDDSLTIIDVSNPANPAVLAEVFDGDGKFSGLNGPISVFVLDKIAYVASTSDNSLTIIDVTDPRNPAPLAELFDGVGGFNGLAGASSVFVSGRTAYVASLIDFSLSVIDVSDPTNPMLLAETSEGGASSVFVSGTTAFVGSGSRPSFSTIDVSDGLSLKIDGDTLISGGAGSVRLSLLADSDNSGETNQPSILMTQDGGFTRAQLGFFDGTNDFEIRTFGNGLDIILSPGRSAFAVPGNVGINRADPSQPLHVGTDSTNGNGAHVTAGGVWTNGSDRNSKTGFAPIDPQAILERLATLPVTEWRYLGEPEDVRHVGPMAQDFMEAFGLGASERHIGTIDADGIALAAIQGLYQRAQTMERELNRRESAMEVLSRRNAGLEARVAENALLAARNAQLESRIVAIERALGLN